MIDSFRLPLYNYAGMSRAGSAESIAGRAPRRRVSCRWLSLWLPLTILLLAPIADAQQSPRPNNPSPAGSGVLRELDDAMENLSDLVGPSVVQIQVSAYGPREEEDLDPQEFVFQHAIGSGIIVDGDGYIMTNNHVVAGAQHVRVVLPAPAQTASSSAGTGVRNRIYDAEILGTDPESDLALVKINAHGLPVIALDSARKVRQGQLVFAVGSPEGLPSTVTMGIVSAVARQVDPKDPMVYIQTDTSINPGNSGGPLVDRDGYLVGINTFIISESKGSSGLGFAIPTARVKFVYDSLQEVRLSSPGCDPGPAAEHNPGPREGFGFAERHRSDRFRRYAGWRCRCCRVARRRCRAGY